MFIIAPEDFGVNIAQTFHPLSGGEKPKSVL